MPSSIQLKNLETIHSSSVKATYRVWKAVDSLRGVSADIEFITHPNCVDFKVNLGEGKAADVQTGFDTLADWMENIAKALRERETTKSQLPLY